MPFSMVIRLSPMEKMQIGDANDVMGLDGVKFGSLKNWHLQRTIEYRYCSASGHSGPSAPPLASAASPSAMTGSSARASKPTMTTNIEVRGGWRLSCGCGRTIALQPLKRAQEAGGPNSALRSPSRSGGS
jgi:hypothetical protein